MRFIPFVLLWHTGGREFAPLARSVIPFERCIYAGFRLSCPAFDILCRDMSRSWSHSRRRGRAGLEFAFHRAVRRDRAGQIELATSGKSASSYNRDDLIACGIVFAHTKWCASGHNEAVGSSTSRIVSQNLLARFLGANLAECLEYRPPGKMYLQPRGSVAELAVGANR